MLITSEKYGLLKLQPGEQIPLPGLSTLHTQQANFPFGNILQTYFDSAFFSLRYFCLDMSEAETLHFSSRASSGIKSIVCLQDSMLWSVNQQDLSLGKDQFLLFHAAVKSSTLSCVEKSSYRFFVIDYHTAGLRKLQAQSPDLQAFLQVQLEALEKGALHSSFASRHVMQLLSVISYQQMPALLFNPWMQNKLSGLLLELLLELYNRPSPDEKRSPLDEICKQAHDFILDNISQHFTISQIARHFRINEQYLKTRFKKNYGTGLYEFFQQERMNEARHLLLTTDMPIKEIAGKVGFEFTSNFITSFSLYFRYTPGSLRRKK